MIGHRNIEKLIKYICEIVSTDIIFMKSNKLIILFLIVVNTVFSQEKIESSVAIEPIIVSKDSAIIKPNYTKWLIEVGTGISNGSRHFTQGYFTSGNNQLFNDFIFNSYSLGARYNFSTIIGIKMDLAFDRFINKTGSKSKPFEVAQYRTSIQGVYNLNSLVKPKNELSKFNLLFHAGIHLAMLQPISADYNKIVSRGDNYGGFVFGFTPTVRISKKIYLFLDFSSFNNYGQNLTWNGKYSNLSNNTEGHMYSGTIGFSFSLDKKLE